MRLLRVALLELRDKALLLVVGLIGGLSAIGIPLLRGVQGPDLASQQAGISFVLACGTVAVTALLLGSGLAGPDLQEGRLGFYFARPLRAFDLWGGRFLAALGINQLGGLLCLLPALLSHREFDTLGAVQGVLLLLGLAGLLLANAASIALRARTAWLILDFAALLAFGWGWIRFIRRIDGAGAGEIFPEAAWVAFGILLALLLLAGFIGFAMGGVSLPKGHRVASLTFAGGVLAALAASVLYPQVALGVKDLRTLKVWSAEAGDRGPWCIVSAEPVAKRLHGYLFNADNGKALRINWEGAVISQDGHRAAWLPSPGLPLPGSSDLWIADLTPGSARVWSLRVPKLSSGNFTWNRVLAISSAGDRLAIAGDEAVAVLSLESGTVLARHAFPSAKALHGSMVFLRNGDLRIYSTKAHSTQGSLIYEIQGDGKDFRNTGEIPSGYELHNIKQDARNETLLLPRKYPSWRGPCLLDARTGQMKAELSSLPHPGSAAATFLPDGRIACVEASDEDAKFSLMDASGVRLWETVLARGLAPAAKEQYGTRLDWDPLERCVRIKVWWGRKGTYGVRRFRIDPQNQAFTEASESQFAERSLRGFQQLQGPVAPDSFQASLRITEKKQLVRVAPDGSRAVLMGPE